MIDRREKWSPSPRVVVTTRNVHTHTNLNTLEKPHDRQVCADPAAANLYGTWTGGNGLAHNGQRAICFFRMDETREDHVKL